MRAGHAGPGHVVFEQPLPTDDVVASAARVAAADVNAEEAPRLVVGRVLQPCGAALARDDQKTLLRRGTLVPRRVTAQEALTTIPVALNGETGRTRRFWRAGGLEGGPEPAEGA